MLEIISSKFLYEKEPPRLCFSEMPPLNVSIASAFNYEADADMAVVVPVFHTRNIRKYKFNADAAFHGFIKRSIYLAYETLNFTDFRKEGLSFYLFIPKEIRPLCLPYLEACEFPINNILWSDFQEKDYPGHLLKICAMAEVIERKEHINKVNYFDASIYFAESRSNNIFHRMKESWTDQPMAFFWDPWLPTRTGEYGNNSYREAVGRYSLSENVSEEMYYEKISALMDMSISEFKNYWETDSVASQLYIEGRTQGYHRSIFENPQFWEFFQAFKAINCADQSFSALYWKKFLGKPSDIIACGGSVWYEKHPEPIKTGNIGFLDSSKSIGKVAREEWHQRNAFSNPEETSEIATFVEFGCGDAADLEFLLKDDWQLKCYEVLQGQLGIQHLSKLRSITKEWFGIFIEPHPLHLLELLKRFQNAGIPPSKYMLISGLVTGNNEVTSLYPTRPTFNEIDHSARTRKSATTDGRRISRQKHPLHYKCVTLNEIVKLSPYPVLFIRADCEGSEVDVFSAYDFEPKPPLLLCEKHGNRQEAIQRIFSSHGYKLDTKRDPTDIYIVGML